MTRQINADKVLSIDTSLSNTTMFNDTHRLRNRAHSIEETSVILSIGDIPTVQRKKLQIFARKSVNEFQIAVDGEETENVPTLTEHQVVMIFESRNKDLDLEFREHQF